jgi:hypothetical protein
MDPITIAIMAVAPALASDLVTNVVKDAYAGVKEIIRRKWGEKSAIDQAITAVEAKPDSKGKAAVLEEEVATVAAQNDPELMAAVQKLVEALQQEGIGGKAVEGIKISISGGTVQGVVGAQNVTVGSMSFGSPPPSEKG